VGYSRIGSWSEAKLEVVRKYSHAYSTILRSQLGLSHLYIDAFAGAGRHIRKETGEFVPGSPLNALTIDPPFDEYHFIDINPKKVDNLRRLAGPDRNVCVYMGDCNLLLPNDIFPQVRWEDYKRALCFLDPYGLHLDWHVIRSAAITKTIEIFLNFPCLDMNRNALLRDPSSTKQEQAARLTRFWGDESWRPIVYKKYPNSDIEYKVKGANKLLAAAFRRRLRDKAGFQFVPEPILLRTNGFSGAPLYYLFFASHNRQGAKIADAIFAHHRPAPELKLF
jgi:three-Cys-motif partner protein